MNKIKEILSKNQYNETYQLVDAKVGNGILNGLTYTVKDNVNVKDTFTTSGSELTIKYKSPFDATIVELLNKAGAELVAKVALDEFGMGGDGQSSNRGPVINPLNKEYQTGGSSSGSAVSVMLGADFSVGSDTGDSLRIPAQYCKVVGFKPTYGAVSRWGVTPFAPSLDHVGVITKDLNILKKVAPIIIDKDEADLTSINIGEEKFSAKPKIAVLVDVINEADPEFKEDFNKLLSKISSKYDVEEISFDDSIYKASETTYKIISTVEAVQNHFPYDGIKFGNKKDTGENIRALFGDTVQNRYGIASYCLFDEKELEIKAYKFRTFIINKMEEVFKKYDIIFTLNAPEKTQKTKEGNRKNTTNHLLFANFAGLPSITAPLYDHGDYSSAINACSKRGTDFALIDFVSEVMSNV